jgi:hypothetical protein
MKYSKLRGNVYKIIIDYWSSEKLFRSGIGDIMSRKRFIMILKFLHIANNREANSDSYYKVRFYVDYLQQKLFSRNTFMHR